MALKNPLWEQLCVLIATGMKPPDAYEDLYNCTRKTALNASRRLMAKPQIRARIEQLQEQSATQSITKNATARAQLMTKLERLLDHSMVIEEKTGKMRDPTNANRAIELYGRELGMFARTTKRAEDDPFAGKSDEEILKIAKQADERIAKHARRAREAAGGASDSEGNGDAPPSDVRTLQ